MLIASLVASEVFLGYGGDNFATWYGDDDETFEDGRNM
jgi:hypothetical protein